MSLGRNCAYCIGEAVVRRRWDDSGPKFVSKDAYPARNGCKTRLVVNPPLRHLRLNYNK